MTTRNDYIYDIETYPNVFTLSVKQAGTNNRWRYEISHRRNDQAAIIQLVMWLASIKAKMVGYNNIGFDYPVVHHLVRSPGATARQLFSLAMKIIQASDEDRFSNVIWERDRLVEQIDLFRIHHFDNKAKATSLKTIEFNMRSDSVQDLPFPPGTTLTDEQIDLLIIYNDHDVDKTESFYFETLPLIQFREDLSTKYGRDFTNHNDGKIGRDIIVNKLEEMAPGTCYCHDADGKRKPRQTWRDSINLRDVVFPWIKFKRPEFETVKEWFCAQTIRQTKGVFNDISESNLGELANHCVIKNHRNKGPIAENLNTVVNGFRFDFGTGGIHGSINNRIVKTDEYYEIIDIDVTSFYPRIGMVNRVYPQHLGTNFCDAYLGVYQERQQHAKGTPMNTALKYSLNVPYGDSNSVYSPFYDPAYTMTITINGQLLICLLADYLIDIPGLEIIQVNTDGITIRLPKSRKGDMSRICDWWQAHTCLDLEFATYDRMWIRDVNSYLAEYEGGKKYKRKGAYAWVFDTKKGLNKGAGDLDWSQNHSELIVSKAAEAALVRGESIREFITNHADPFDFMIWAKVPRSSRLVISNNGVDIPQTNAIRCYVSNNGGALVKIMPPLPRKPGVERRISIAAGWNVTECNNISTFDPTNVNFEYYIQAAEKLVLPLKHGR